MNLAHPLIRTSIANINGVVFAEPVVFDLVWDETLTVDRKDLFGSDDVTVTAVTNVLAPQLQHSVFHIDREGMRVMLEVSVGLAGQDTAPAAGETLNGGTGAPSFGQFSDAFEATWDANFDPLTRGTAMELQISKRTLSRFMNAALTGQTNLVSRLTTPRESFSDTIEFDRRQIDCEDVRQPFRYGRYQRRSCDYNCDAYTDLPFGGSIRVRDGNLGCVADRARCNTQEEARVLADNIARESAQVAHNAAQESVVASCRAVRAASEFIARGRFAGDTQVNATYDVDLQRMQFDETLTRVEVDLQGAVDARLQSRFRIQPMDLGYIFMCQSDVQDTVNSNLQVAFPASSYAMSIVAEERDEGVALLAAFEPFRYDAVLDPSPIYRLMDDNNFSSKCRILKTVMGISLGAGNVANDLGMINVEPEIELLLRGRA